MPRLIRTARGDLVDFDALIIKQQLANAPMNVEVANRKQFIDTQEAKRRGQRAPAVTKSVEQPTEVVQSTPHESKKK